MRQGDTRETRVASVRVPLVHLPAFEAAFRGADALSVTIEANKSCHLEGVYGAQAERSEVLALVSAAAAAVGLAPPALAWDALPDRDWVAAGLAALPPVRAGRFRVRGAHHARGSRLHELHIEAGPAFGTGHHETTRGCLLVLDRLARMRRFVRPLDMGCGSGVLALAMARLWHRRAIAVDNDAMAVAAARENVHRNRLEGLVTCRRGEGFSALRRGERFDLIAANILARPLIAMAPAMRACLMPGGVAVVSGVLREQAPFVLNAFRRHGLALRGRVDVGAWPTLYLCRPSAVFQM